MIFHSLTRASFQCGVSTCLPRAVGPPTTFPHSLQSEWPSPAGPLVQIQVIIPPGAFLTTVKSAGGFSPGGVCSWQAVDDDKKVTQGCSLSGARFQHFQRCALFRQVEFFQGVAGSTTRLSHILNLHGGISNRQRVSDHCWRVNHTAYNRCLTLTDGNVYSGELSKKKET